LCCVCVKTLLAGIPQLHGQGCPCKGITTKPRVTFAIVGKALKYPTSPLNPCQLSFVTTLNKLGP